MSALYNENEPYAAAWLKNLSEAGHIAHGRVETKSIVDLTPEDIGDAVQFHAFAGIGVWSYALRLAGWPDSAPVWSGSAPCQPWSVAGRGKGVEDERHLWPAWFRLIRQCSPPAVFGEQVASKPGLAWLDAVLADLEGAGYAVGVSDLCAAGVGAPHIRQRLYFCAFRMADAAALGQFRRGPSGTRAGERSVEFGRQGDAGGLVDASSSRSGRNARAVPGAEGGAEQRVRGVADLAQPPGPTGELGNASGSGLEGRGSGVRVEPRDASSSSKSPLGGAGVAGGACRGFWANAQWVPCRDGKWRPVEPGTQPLVDRAPTRVGPGGAVETQPRTGRLRGYGNAIVAECAAMFIRSAMEAGNGA